jgi:hypothetical protein
VGDVLGDRAVLSRERDGVLAVVSTRCPQLTQSRLLPLRDGRLRSETAKNVLAGGIEPVIGESVDHLAPDPLLDGIEVGRRLRATPPGKAGNDSELGGGSARHRRSPRSNGRSVTRGRRA